LKELAPDERRVDRRVDFFWFFLEKRRREYFLGITSSLNNVMKTVAHGRGARPPRRPRADAARRRRRYGHGIAGEAAAATAPVVL